MGYHDEDRRRCNHDGGYCHHECGVNCFREKIGASLTTPYPGFPREQDAAEAEVYLRAKLEEPAVDPGQAAMVAVVDALIAKLMGGEVKP